MYYQSDALHWNLSQIDNVGKLEQKAMESYSEMSGMVTSGDLNKLLVREMIA